LHSFEIFSSLASDSITVAKSRLHSMSGTKHQIAYLRQLPHPPGTMV
jgi:hypothetical protein